MEFHGSHEFLIYEAIHRTCTVIVAWIVVRSLHVDRPIDASYFGSNDIS